VLVHYDPRRPEDACLAYGWHSWSIGLPLFFLGMGLQGWGERRGGRRGRVAQVVGWTLVPLAVLCLFLTHDVLRPSDLPLAGAIAVAVLAARLLYRLAGGGPPR
jgi:peptidoglycan/LPS O-acetylase OafA/YrhL